ncbi:MAG: hypothetical protein DMG24_05470 [Acidobacteria bacterium]|nr:MAG: hypothetical protein DMG24_05470 [Acidobacteriota bacterium]
MFGWGRSKGLVGLDIGSSSVKAIELRKKGGKYEVLNLAVEDLHPERVAEEPIRDRSPLAEAIDQIFAKNHIQTNEVATAVSGHSVIVKKIAVTGSSPEELREAIAYEAEQNIQLDLNEVKWDYEVLGPAASGRNAFDVMLVAVKRDKILNHTAVLKQAGKTPVIIDIDAFALQNAWEMSYEPPPEEVAALLDIGANVTTINIVRAGTPLFTRHVSIGGQHSADALETALAHEAGQVSPDTRMKCLRATAEIILLEIQKTFDFFRETSAEGVHHVYVAGGFVTVSGMADILKDELRIPTEIMDPFRRVTFNGPKLSVDRIGELAPRMGVAMGLALRSFD